MEEMPAQGQSVSCSSFGWFAARRGYLLILCSSMSSARRLFRVLGVCGCFTSFLSSCRLLLYLPSLTLLALQFFVLLSSKSLSKRRRWIHYGI
ncbi:uncharacterized protein [Aegilops tauschii subsp. strangulata]|uniref:uncharacterized protein isoform X3 n=1 Tax=Triticum aestivum TaxID=4565 RepID=UPI00098A2A8E|nr:uncharacterized protein LOC123170128 isoform X3 [Triticum aestivum]